MRSDPSYSFVVGENGRRSGLAIAGSDRAEVRILILPKMWHAAEQPSVLTEPIAGGDRWAVSIVCREKQRIRLVPKGSVARSIWPDVLACCSSIAETAEAVATANDTEEGEDEGDGVEANPEARKRLCALVRPATSGTTLEVETATADTDAANGCKQHLQKSWHDFLRLRQRGLAAADRARQDRKWAKSLANVSAVESANSLLAPLLRSRFVAAVSDLIHHVRPGYVRVTQPTKFIRGRMNPTSAAIAMRGGSDTVICTYEVFGLDTPLLRVISAALQEVADDHPDDGSGENSAIGIETDPEVVTEANWLLSRLEGVSQISRNHATRLGQVLLPGLSRLDEDWRIPLRLACLVLDNKALDPLAHDDVGHFGWQGQDVPSSIFDCDTALFWERIVLDACRAGKKPDRKQAWKPVAKNGRYPQTFPSMQADIANQRTATKGPDVLVTADVKYMDWLDVPRSEVQRQLFTYSHLYAKDGIKHQRAYVFYAGNQKQSPEGRTRGPRLVRMPQVASPGPADLPARVILQSICLPFPQPEDLTDWPAYQKKLQEHLPYRLRQPLP